MSRRDAARRSSQPSTSRPADRSEPLTVSEIWLLVFAGANLVITPWALGGMAMWSQYLSLGLSVGALVAALYSPDFVVRRQRRGRLFRFPAFWIGIVCFIFVLLQAVNPAWSFQSVGEGWQLVGRPHVSWLPHGIANTPYKMMSPWRVLVIHGSAWLLICSLWIGINRRRTARALLIFIAAGGALMALVFIVQRLTQPEKILWIWKAPADYFVGGFIYKNHAGVYFNLIIAACLGLACWYAGQASRQMKKSHPGLLYVFMALVVFVAQLFTYSRASTLTSAAIILVVAVAIAGRMIFRSVAAMPRSIVAVMTLLAAGFIGVCAISLNPGRVWERFGRLLQEDQASSITARQIATRATMDMAKDSLWVGHGAGGFRFLFPLYQERYPEILRIGQGPNAPRYFWEHAHDDYVEGLAEYGLSGVALFLTLIGCTIAALWRAKAWSQPAFLASLTGAVAVLANAAVDFPLQNPGVVLTTVGCVTLVTRWAQLEPRSRIIPAPLRE